MKFWSSVFTVTLMLCVCDHVKSQDQYARNQKEGDDSIVGAWEWTMAVGPMKKKISMEVTEKDGKVTAVVISPEGKKLEAKDFEQREDRIQFTIVNEEGGRSMTLVHDGKIKGNKITGTAEMQGGPFDMKFKWDASRVAKKRSVVPR